MVYEMNDKKTKQSKTMLKTNYVFSNVVYVEYKK